MIYSILLASLSLSVFALLAAFLLKRFKIKSPLFHRVTWGLVLAQGLVFVGVPLKLAVLEAAPQVPRVANTAVVPPVAFEPASPNFAKPFEAQPAPVGQRFSTSVNPWVVLYIGGAAIGLLYFAIAYLALLFSVRKASSAPEDWQVQFRNLLESRNIDTDSVALLVHSRLGPLLCRLPSGYAIVLPAREWRSLSEEQREAVLLHEIAHIERRDIWKTLAMRLVALCHWFNPLAWWAARQFEEAAEWDCDQRLFQRGKTYAVNYAKALLAFAEPKSLPVGASLARGAALSPRIDRLTSFGRKSRDPIFRRILFSSLILICAGFSLLRLELVAQENDDEDDNDEIELEDRAAFIADLKAMGDRIDGSGEVISRLKKSINSKPGQIVMKAAAEEAGEEEQERLSATAVPDHFGRFYEQAEGALQLKPEHQSLKPTLLKTHQSFEKDIASVQAAMADIKKSLAKESEAGKMLDRLLGTKEAAHWVYYREIREQMHPGQDTIQEELGGILVPDGQNKLSIPKSRIRMAKKFAKQGESMLALAKAFRGEISDFAKDIATPDQFHKDIKKAMLEPSFADYLATEVGDDEPDIKASVAVSRLFDGLEDGFYDKADGLHINPDAKDEIKERWAHYRASVSNLGAISEELKRFASQIDPKDDLHKSLQSFLMSPVAGLLFGRDFEGGQDAGYVFRAMIEEVLVSNKGGKKRVVGEQQEEVVELVREALREIREMKRNGRQLGELATEIKDEELANVYQTFTGRLVVIDRIVREIEMSKRDGLAIWISQHFEEDEKGFLHVRAQSMEHLNDLVEEADEIANNLDSDL